MSDTFTIIIANERGDEDQLSVMLTADTSEGVTGLTVGASTPLTSLNADRKITIKTIKSGRLYVGYGTLPAAPVAEGSQYFGWVEFSRLEDDQVWINLSSVDIVGLPLTLRGKADQKPFTLGYKVSKNAIVQQLEGIAAAGAKITCQPATNPPQLKIVGPTKMSDAYPSFRAYRKQLTDASASLNITSDATSSGLRKTFHGSMLTAESDDDPIIQLKSDQGDTFRVNRGQFLSSFIYRCDGGKLIYNGVTVDQNQSPQDTDDKLFANSVYRNLLIGMHEAYFTQHGKNASADFGGLTPFANGQGNAYARVLHETSNSYGFPYADSNLKVLIKADPEATITLAIIKDEDAKDYDSTPIANKPQFGDYQFGIGTGSSALGEITIGGWRYLPESNGSYGGFLPTADDWTQMNFSRPGHTPRFIWFKTTGAGAVSAGGCFTTGDPVFINKVLTWGANVNWKSGHASPARPTS